MKKLSLFCKILFRKIKDDFVRLLANCYAVIYFAFNGCILNKPRIVRGCKYISLDNNCSIYQGVRIQFFVQDNIRPNLKFGKNVLIGYNCSFLVTTTLEIGDYTMIASDCLLTTENHGIDLSFGNYCDQKLINKSIKIGRNVWIGEKCVILPGVEIGDNVVVGSSSVVTKNIPSNHMACGSPAKIIKVYNFKENKWERIETNEK